MRKKQSIVSCNLSDKNRIYLERLGVLDGRTGRKRKKAPSVSDVINRSLTVVFERKKALYNSVASPDELSEAWIEFQIQELNRDVNEARDEIVRLAKMKPSYKEAEKALLENS